MGLEAWVCEVLELLNALGVFRAAAFKVPGVFFSFGCSVSFVGVSFWFNSGFIRGGGGGCRRVSGFLW